MWSGTSAPVWATATAAEKTHQVLEEARTQLPTRALGWADQAWRYSATAGKTYREGLPRKTQEIYVTISKVKPMARTKELKSKPGANHLNLIQVNLTKVKIVTRRHCDNKNPGERIGGSSFPTEVGGGRGHR